MIRAPSLRRSRPVIRVLIVLIGSMVIVLVASAPLAGQEPARVDPESCLRRIIHTFDFDERDQGNLEDVPRYWTEFGGASFPQFVGGRFDPDVGHERGPSFYLEPKGRNVAYRYTGKEIPVVTNCDYTVGAWIRPDRLSRARAALSAYYVDREGLPLAGTQRFSKLVGPDGSNDEWRQVRVQLPTVPVEGSRIGLTVWVVQPEVWDLTPRPVRHIEYRDIQGGAWFDDIVAYRLPRASLEADSPANLFVAPRRPTLKVIVSDNDGMGLQAVLNVRPAHSSEAIWKSAVPIDTSMEGRPSLIEIESLEPGCYLATLEIMAEGREVATRSLRFVNLAAAQRQAGTSARPFGVVLDAERSPVEAEKELLTTLGVGAVKLPIWNDGTETEDGMHWSENHDALLHELIKLRVALIGYLAEDRASHVGGVAARPHLLKTLADDPSVWSPSLARIVAPYSNILRSWQLGADGDPDALAEERLGPALIQVRQEMSKLMNSPHLTAPAAAEAAPSEAPLPAEGICVAVPNEIQPAWIADHLKDYRNLGYEHVSAYIPPISDASWSRVDRLAQWTQSILFTRFSGIDTVFTPQLWRSRWANGTHFTEPTEEFVIFRTLADMLNDAEPAEKLDLEDGATALCFRKQGRSVWALWDSTAEAGEKIHRLQLGSATRQVDVWGRSQPLNKSADGTHEVKLGTLPVFVDGVESWATTLRATTKLTPERVSFSLGAHEVRLALSNSHEEGLSGEVQLTVPEAWEVKPRTFRVNLGPGEQREYPFELRFDGNESAGTKTILARVHVHAPQQLVLEMPLNLMLTIDGVEVWGYAVMQDDRLILRHGITNRSDEPLSFRAYATAPGRNRQSRVVANIAPGRVAAHEYHFPHAADLRGRTVRLSLKEVDGMRIHNLDIQVP